VPWDRVPAECEDICHRAFSILFCEGCTKRRCAMWTMPPIEAAAFVMLTVVAVALLF
jgi:hypothetical protein